MQTLWPRRAELRWNKNMKTLGSLRIFPLLLTSVDLTSSNGRISKSHRNKQVCLPEEAMTETTMIWQFMLPTWIFTIQPQTCLGISFYWLDPKMGLSLSLSFTQHTQIAVVEFTSIIRLAAWSIWHLWRQFKKSARLMTQDYFTSQSFCLLEWVLKSNFLRR